MNSSTSSSRNIFLKIFIVIILGMGISMGIVNLITYSLGASTENIMGRVIQAQLAMPDILQENENLLMIFGSSMVEAGFSPRQFDREVRESGKNIKSYNFGFGGLNPFFQDYLSRRIRENFKKNNKRLKLAIIEFNPFQTTKTRWNNAGFVLDSFLTMLANNQELFHIALDDPTRGIRLFNIKYARSYISAEMITSYFGRSIFPSTQSRQFEIPENIITRRKELQNKMGELFKKDFPDYKDERWHMGWQGGTALPEEESKLGIEVTMEYYSLNKTDAMMNNDRQHRIRTADIEELDFEPILIEHFIKVVKNFQSFSDKVEVVMLPRNSRWIHYTDDAGKRLNTAIKTIENELKLTVRNHQNLSVINPDMFRDTTHLEVYTGSIAYTHFLVNEYIKDL